MMVFYRLFAVAFLAVAAATFLEKKRNFFATLVHDFEEGGPQDQLGFIKKCDATLMRLLPDLQEEYTWRQVPPVLFHSCEAYDQKDDFNREGGTNGLARAKTRCQYFARELGSAFKGKQQYHKWCESVWEYLASEALTPEQARVKLREAELIRHQLDAAKDELRRAKARNRVEVVIGGGGRDAFKKAMVPWSPPSSGGSGKWDEYGDQDGDGDADADDAAVAVRSDDGHLCCPGDCDVCQNFEVVKGIVRKDHGGAVEKDDDEDDEDDEEDETASKGKMNKLPKFDENATHVKKEMHRLAKKLTKPGHQSKLHNEKKKGKSEGGHDKTTATATSAKSRQRKSSGQKKRSRSRTPTEVNGRVEELHRKLRKSSSDSKPPPAVDSSDDLAEVKVDPVEGMDEMVNRSATVDRKIAKRSKVLNKKHASKRAPSKDEDDEDSEDDDEDEEDDEHQVRKVTSEEVDKKLPEILRKVDKPSHREKLHPVPFGGAAKNENVPLDDMVAETSKRVNKIVQKSLRVQNHELDLGNEVDKKVAEIIQSLGKKEDAAGGDHGLHLQATAAAAQKKEENKDDDDNDQEDEDEEEDDDTEASALLQERAKSGDIYHVLIKEFEKSNVFPSHIKTKPFLDRCTDIISNLMPQLQDEYTYPQVPSILLHECDVYRSAEDFKTDEKHITHAVDSCRYFAKRLANQFTHHQDYRGWCANVYAQLLRDSGKTDLTDKQRALLKERPDFSDDIFENKRFRVHGRKGASNGCCPANCRVCKKV